MRKILLVVLAAALIVGLVSCATIGHNLKGDYREVQLQVDVFKISVGGSIHTSRDRLFEMALFRAAELCLMNGYRYFYVLDDKTDTEYHTYDNYLYDYDYDNSQYTRTYVGSYQTTKYTVVLTVKLTDESIDDVELFDAVFLYNSLENVLNNP